MQHRDELPGLIEPPRLTRDADSDNDSQFVLATGVPAYNTLVTALVVCCHATRRYQECLDLMDQSESSKQDAELLLLKGESADIVPLGTGARVGHVQVHCVLQHR